MRFKRLPKKPYAKTSAATLLAVGLATPTQAGIPTIDVANIIQTTITAIENIQQGIQLYEQIDNQINQIENQVKQFENMNGDYLKHLLLNTEEYKRARRWVPKTYQEVLDLYKDVNTTGYEDTAHAGWEARDDMQVIDSEQFYEDPDSQSAMRWRQHENDTMAAVGVAQMSYERVDTLLEETESLIADIQSSQDAKASQDLANRMMAQTHMLLAELIRIQSTQTTTQARHQMYEHSLRSQEKRMLMKSAVPGLVADDDLDF